MPRRAARGRGSTVADVHELAAAMPGAELAEGSKENPIYAVRGKSFVFFRNPRPDAVDPVTGERYTDVICMWTETLEDKQALVEDPSNPFFTTPHFDGYRAVLVRASRLGEVDRDELAEVIADAWLARAEADGRRLVGGAPTRARIRRSPLTRPRSNR